MSNDYNGKKRSELPDSVFGIPQERKYPMPDEKHTRSAIKLFNHVEPKYEEQLAKAVIKNMKKYNIDGSIVGPNNRLRKYLPKDMIKEGVVYIDYTLIKGAQPPYSAKNHRVYDGNLLKEATTEVINEKLNIFKKSSNDSGRKSREEAYRKATSHVTKYLSKYIGLRKGQVIYASSNVHLDEYMNPKDRLQIFEDFMNGKRKSIAIYHNMIYNNYGRKGFDWTKENILKPVDEMCDAFDHDGYELCAGVNEQYTSLLVSLRVKSVNESSMFEGYIKSDKDIYYNKDKFDSGEINLCFITGLSGSGKSTMARGMTSKNIEHYEMDDIICNDNFSDSNLKEYGGLIESFFKGPGKSFRLIRDNDTHNNSVFKSHKNYEKEITQAFVKHALSYCKSHMNTKFICDGIWVFMFINPSQLKDCAVYIKGTSSLKSGYRALKRDIDEDKRNNMTSLDIFKREFRRIKEDVLYAKENQKELKSFRSYFKKQSTNESVSSTVSKDHKQKGYIKLSSLKKIRITETIINKYKKEYPVLRHVRCKDTDEYVCDGYMWFKDDDLVCYVGSCQYTDDKTKWIVSLEILPKYRGYGLSNQILDFCVKSMNCKYLSVNKNNELAKKIYDKYGFKVYHEDKTMYYMTLDTISPKNESGGYIYSFERSPIQEYDYIPESGILSVIKPIPTKDKNKIKYIMEDLGDDFKDFVFANICFYDIEEYEKTPIGFVILRKKPELHTAFVSIGVSEQHRNSGVGSKLLQKTISYFKSTKDLMWLEYWVNIDNKASIALAEKSGFVEYLSGDTAKALGYYHYHMKNNNNLYEASISEYGTTGGTIVGSNQPLYFYHMVDSGANLSKGLLSLGYMYHHSKPLFLKNASKYRDRLCNGWDIYPGRDPKSLTAEEIYEGIKKFRNEDNLNTIYFFRYPPYSSLDKRFDRLYKYKKLYRININDPKVKSIIKNINYGWIDSNTGNDPLDRKYYETISPEDYFNNFDPDKGLLFSTLHHISIEVKNGYIPMKLLEEVKVPNTIEDIISMEESSIQEYGTTGGTIVGANQPDSVYIVKYMQNNVFSGYKEPKFGVCRKGMKDLHIVGGKYNRFHYVSDLDKFKEEASDIHVYRYKGKPKNEFFDIIEEMKDDNDLDLYKLITGREIKDRSEIRFDGDFIEEECFFDTIDAIKACTEAGLLEASTDLHPIPILTETVQGRPYNYYRDLNGVFIQHEITGLRSKSYETLDDIPEAEKDIVKRGYLV